MTKLIIATENFPYGRGEDSFILPELRRLKEEYDITILSHASREQYQNGMQAPLPEGISVIWQGRPVLSGWDKLKASLLYALDGDGRQEIREIIHQFTLLCALSLLRETQDDGHDPVCGVVHAQGPGGLVHLLQRRSVAEERRHFIIEL